MNGVPYDVAFSMEDVELTAAFISIGQLSGGKWNWAGMCWEKQEKPG